MSFLQLRITFPIFPKLLPYLGKVFPRFFIRLIAITLGVRRKREGTENIVKEDNHPEKAFLTSEDPTPRLQEPVKI